MTALTQRDVLAHLAKVPWPSRRQVEQDLLLCRAMAALFNIQFQPAQDRHCTLFFDPDALQSVPLSTNATSPHGQSQNHPSGSTLISNNMAQDIL